MSFKKHPIDYDIPLNNKNKIHLPSNLLEGRPTTRYQLSQESKNTEITPRQTLEPIRKSIEPKVMMMEEEDKTKKNVIYKRISQIQTKNDDLEKYSYSKLLAKMVVVDEDQQRNSFYNTVGEDFDYSYKRTIPSKASEYNCIKARLMSLEV